MTPFGEVLPQDEEYDPSIARMSLAGTAAPRVKPERDVVRDGIAFLRGLPCGYAWKIHGGPMGNVGEPDVDACVNGRTVKLEAKRIGNRPTGPQMSALRRWASVGALVGWFRTNAEIQQILDHLGDQGFVPDLRHPGCHCPRHVGGAS